MTKKREKKTMANGPVRQFERKAHNVKPSERGLGPAGGGWNVEMASTWSGIGSASLRAMAKESIETGNPSLFPCYMIGKRRILIPRQGFMDWFNRGSANTAA